MDTGIKASLKKAELRRQVLAVALARTVFRTTPVYFHWLREQNQQIVFTRSAHPPERIVSAAWLILQLPTPAPPSVTGL